MSVNSATITQNVTPANSKLNQEERKDTSPLILFDINWFVRLFRLKNKENDKKNMCLYKFGCSLVNELVAAKQKIPRCAYNLQLVFGDLILGKYSKIAL